MSYFIISPTTTERVIVGVCHKPNWLYVALKEKGEEVRFYEDATLPGCDPFFADLDPATKVVVDLSSYPQLDVALQIEREFGGAFDIKYIGLDALITENHLPLFIPEDHGVRLVDGVFVYHRYIDQFLPRLHTDYDSHIAQVDDGKDWMPAFFSIGCERKCPYCYVGYSSFPSGSATMEQVDDVIAMAVRDGKNIHFYDEDFFQHPQLETILSKLHGKGVRWICLTTSVSLSKAMRSFGVDYLVECGNALNEVGVETVNPDVLDKRQDLVMLIDNAHKIPVLWMTVSFFPRETIRSKYEMGCFLRAHAYGWDEMLPRMLCNSTHGGLGQFYVPYHGTPWQKQSHETGVRLHCGPVHRLWPSYIPHTFLKSVPELGPEKIDDVDVRWCSLYRGNSRQKVEELLSLVDGRTSVESICGLDDLKLIGMAQAAQLGLVR